MNTKQKGNIGLGKAISYFLSLGWSVSLPINDSQQYDLVVEFPNEGLKKIEVKTSTYKSKYGIYVVGLRTMGGNQSYNYARNFNSAQCDYVFAHTINGDNFLIPSTECPSNAISLGGKYLKYKLGDDPVGGL